MSEAKNHSHRDDSCCNESKEEKDAKVVPIEDKESDDGNNIIEKVKRFFYEDDSFSNEFEKFANDNCREFDVDAEEMKLEYTALHKQFVALFEERMEEFVQSQGSSISTLYQKIQEQVEKDPEGDASLFAQIVIATTDFDIFVRIMQEARRQQIQADAK